MDPIEQEFDTLSETINHLTFLGYNEDFEAGSECIVALYSKQEFLPNELKIVKRYRFEGMTDPGDQVLLIALEAKNGTKGTLVMSYAAEHNQNVDLIALIEDI